MQERRLQGTRSSMGARSMKLKEMDLRTALTLVSSILAGIVIFVVGNTLREAAVEMM